MQNDWQQSTNQNLGLYSHLPKIVQVYLCGFRKFHQQPIWRNDRGIFKVILFQKTLLNNYIDDLIVSSSV